MTHKFIIELTDTNKESYDKTVERLDREFGIKEVEEIDNPCIECGGNCCSYEYNGEKCEWQKVFVLKENVEGNPSEYCSSGELKGESNEQNINNNF